jgi:hypothetical protein
MKKNLNSVCVLMLVVTITLLVFSCASTKPKGPVLGEPNLLQGLLNEIPAIPLSGKNVKFEFGGDVWISTVDGKGFLAGTTEYQDTADGSTLTLKQTHVYSDKQNPVTKKELGWVKTPGPNITLEYKKGPPPSFTVK